MQRELKPKRAQERHRGTEVDEEGERIMERISMTKRELEMLNSFDRLIAHEQQQQTETEEREERESENQHENRSWFSIPLMSS